MNATHRKFTRPPLVSTLAVAKAGAAAAPVRHVPVRHAFPSYEDTFGGLEAEASRADH